MRAGTASAALSLRACAPLVRAWTAGFMDVHLAFYIDCAAAPASWIARDAALVGRGEIIHFFSIFFKSLGLCFFIFFFRMTLYNKWLGNEF